MNNAPLHRQYAKAAKKTVQNPNYSMVFEIGDGSPFQPSKTEATLCKQAPVLIDNLPSVRCNEMALVPARYDGSTFCPLVADDNTLVLAVFDDLWPKETGSGNQAKGHLTLYVLKAYGLPAMDWHGMLRGCMEHADICKEPR